MEQPTRSDEGSRTHFYCCACNQQFVAETASDGCPRCGASVPQADSELLGSTVLMNDTGDIVTSMPVEDQEESDPLVGKRLHIYRCETLLGRGGMGRVYLAFHEDLQRHCALKVLMPWRVASDPLYLDRFIQEGRAAAALNHPNVVTTHAVGEEEGYHFLELEFVGGGSLHHLIDREGRLDCVRATSLIAQTARGLAAAHQVGIVHRDVKLDNILLAPDSTPKIGDFGLAKRVVSADAAAYGDFLCGTPHFMAPELFRGVPATPASDVYALGVCYFLLLAARYPFSGNSLPELHRSICTESPPSLREEHLEMTLEMAECLEQFMAKSPKNRPQDATEAALILDAVLGDVRDLETLVSEALNNTATIRWNRSDDRYRVQLKLPQNRSQTVFIESSDDVLGDYLLLIYSVCCPAESEFYEHALHLNSEMRHGALALRDVDGVESFVVVDTYPRSTVNAEEIRRSVWEVAQRADAVEKTLTGRDRN